MTHPAPSRARLRRTCRQHRECAAASERNSVWAIVFFMDSILLLSRGWIVMSLVFLLVCVATAFLAARTPPVPSPFAAPPEPRGRQA